MKGRTKQNYKNLLQYILFTNHNGTILEQLDVSMNERGQKQTKQFTALSQQANSSRQNENSYIVYSTSYLSKWLFCWIPSGQFEKYLMLNVWSHFLLFRKILWLKSSYFNRIYKDFSPILFSQVGHADLLHWSTESFVGLYIATHPCFLRTKFCQNLFYTFTFLFKNVYFIFIFLYIYILFKGIVHPKMYILSSFPYPHVILNLCKLELLWKSMGTINCLITRKKETHAE